MFWILGALIFVFVAAFFFLMIMHMLLKHTAISRRSKDIVNKFEPQNTAPKLTDMINYYKENSDAEYII